MYDTILLDLDGTLTDPGLGITNSVMYALEKFGIYTQDRTSLYHFIGPPLLEEIQRSYGFSEEQALKALAYYREYFGVTGLFENEVYDGIPETLEKMKDAGKKLIVATSKPELYSVRILEHFDLLRYFDFVAGSTMDNSRVRKADVIAYALKENSVDKNRAIMVGDRQNDVQGAIANGLDCLGVLYGYGSLEELKQAGAMKFADSPEDILNYI